MGVACFHRVVKVGDRVKGGVVAYTMQLYPDEDCAVPERGDIFLVGVVVESRDMHWGPCVHVELEPYDVGHDRWYEERNEALAKVKRLKAQLAECREELAAAGEKGGWIRVDERLPDEGQIVDIWYAGRRETDYRHVRDYGGQPGNDFFDPIGAGVLCVRKATHWRPRPTRPKEGK